MIVEVKKVIWKLVKPGMVTQIYTQITAGHCKLVCLSELWASALSGRACLSPETQPGAIRWDPVCCLLLSQEIMPSILDLYVYVAVKPVVNQAHNIWCIHNTNGTPHS